MSHSHASWRANSIVWRSIVLLLLLVASHVFAMNAFTVSVEPVTVGSTALAETARRPRICVVLSGGGARGYAHIGVLKQLEALHVPVDCIAGTSMGALIGGLYASGMSAEAIENALKGVDLTDIAFDREARANQPQAVRKDNLDYPVGLPLGFGANGFASASGLVQGNQLLALLQAHMSQLPGDVDFDALPVPFRAVATDIETGDKVVLRKGSLPHAIRASMAVPGLFAPIVLDRRMLVDGGIVDNLPVDVARQMGADIVIAINIGTPLKRADELKSMTGITQQVFGVLISQNVRAQKAQLHDDDLLLEPDLNGVAFTDFADSARGIAAGATAVENAAARFQPLSLKSDAWVTYLAARNQSASLPDGTTIDRVMVTTNGRVPASRVTQRLRAKAGDVYDPVAIDRDLAALNSASDFESVSHTFTGPEGDRVLHVTANSKLGGRTSCCSDWACRAISAAKERLLCASAIACRGLRRAALNGGTMQF